MKDDYYGYISKNYDDVKNSIRTWSCGNLDEDIFHDTLIKCAATVKVANMTNDQIAKYIFKAYKTNVLREKNYARNRIIIYTDDLPDTRCDIDKSEYVRQRDMVRKFIVDKYGDDIFEAFAQWVIDGKSVAKIERDMNLKSLTYKFGIIRNYIDSNYDKDVLYNIQEQTDSL